MRKRTIWTILAGLVALVIAGFAVAAKHGAGTEAAMAKFSATEVKRMKSRTCEGSDGTYKITHAVLEGEVTDASNPVLQGELRLHLKSVFNMTKNLGWVSGKAHIRNETADPDTRARASFKAVNVGGELEGLFVGGAGAPHWKLLANFSADLSLTAPTEGQVTSGMIGEGSSDNSALLFRGGCRAKPDGPAIASERGRGHGEGKGKGKRKP